MPLEYIRFFLSGGIWGAAEILPFSASALQRLAEPYWDPNRLMPELGLLIAVILLYHRSLYRMLIGGWRMLAGSFSGTFHLKKANRDQLLLLYTLLAAVPTVALMLISHYAGLTADLSGRRLMIGIMFLFNGAALYIGSHSLCKNWGIEDMKSGHAFKLGLFQAVACILPGLSRSAILLTMGRNMGFKREDAFEFSMIAGIPAMICSMALRGTGEAVFDEPLYWMMLAGSALFGAAALLFARWLVKKDRYGWLGFLCLAAGIAAIIMNYI